MIAAKEFIDSKAKDCELSVMLDFYFIKSTVESFLMVNDRETSCFITVLIHFVLDHLNDEKLADKIWETYKKWACFSGVPISLIASEVNIETLQKVFGDASYLGCFSGSLRYYFTVDKFKVVCWDSEFDCTLKQLNDIPGFESVEIIDQFEPLLFTREYIQNHIGTKVLGTKGFGLETPSASTYSTPVKQK